MEPLLLPALIAFLLTLISVPLTIKLARRYGLVDDPGTRPHPAHLHKSVLPRAGGLAIFITILSTSLIFLPLEPYLVGILTGITVLLLMGLADDKLVNFNPYIRLVLLFLAAAAPVFTGIGISFINNPLFGLGFLPPNLSQNPYIYFDKLTADVFAFLWIVTLTQVINWSKGVDGQMPGITAVAAIILGFLSLKIYGEGDLNQLNVATLSFIVAGTSLGFLIFNWHPAKILPGFSGSTILAFMLATLSILSGAKVATAILVLAVPTIDFIYTVLRRVFKGRSPVWGDRGHLHHKLLDLGWSHQKISLFYIIGSAILGAIALIVDTQSKMFALLLVAIIFFGFVLWLNSFGVFSKRSARDNG